MANSRKYTRKMKKLTRKMKQKKYSMKKGGFWPFDSTKTDETKSGEKQSSMFDFSKWFATKTDIQVIEDLKQQQQKCVDDIQVKIDKITEKQQSSTQPTSESSTQPTSESSTQSTSESSTEPTSESSSQQNPGQKTMGGRRRRKRTYSKK